MTIWNYTVIGLLGVGFFGGLYRDFYGFKQRAPYGFSGAVMTILLTAAIAFVYYKAGAFGR